MNVAFPQQSILQDLNHTRTGIEEPVSAFTTFASRCISDETERTDSNWTTLRDLYKTAWQTCNQAQCHYRDVREVWVHEGEWLREWKRATPDNGPSLYNLRNTYYDEAGEKWKAVTALYNQAKASFPPSLTQRKTDE